MCASRLISAAAAAFLAAAASAQQPPTRARAFARDPGGAFWTVLDDAGAFRAEKRTSAGAFVAATALPDALAGGQFDLAFDASGNAWVLGAKAPLGLPEVGLWKVSVDGQTLLASGGVGSELGAALGGGVAVDAAGNVWVTGARQTGPDETFQLALWRFAPDATPNQAPTYVQRPNGGQLDYGADLVIDPGGTLWVVGASSNPVTSAIDLAFWSFDAAGAPSGGPHLWPDARPAGYRLGLTGEGGDDDGLAAALALRADGSLWAATSKRAAACANPDLALLRLSAGGTVAGATYWRDAAALGATARGLAADASGGLFAVGTAAGRSALWRFGAAGSVAPGYPRAADVEFLPDMVAVAPAGTPWVVVSSAPAVFTGGTFVAGTEGPSVCGAAGTAQVSGTLSYPAGLVAGTPVGVFLMGDLASEPAAEVIVAAPGGPSVPYALPAPAPGSYYVLAQVDPAASETPGRPLGSYLNFTRVSVQVGQPVAGVDFLLAVDLSLPTASVTSFVDGSTLTALSFIEGAAGDDMAVAGLELAVEDLDTGLWWKASERSWLESVGGPLFQDARAAFSGHPADVAWQADVHDSTGPTQGLAPLAGYLAPGHTYRVHVRAGDPAGNDQDPSVRARFTWQGPQGNLTPNPPQTISAAALGVSSISWTWTASLGAASYVVYSASADVRIAATSGTSYLQAGLAANTLSGVCVSAVNAFGEGPRNCGPGTFTLAAVPGAPTATAASSDTLTWAWDKAGNDYQPTYELSLSTDDFATLSVLIPFAAQLQSETTTVFGLTPATAYQARVRAANGTGVPTAYSAPGSTRTLSAPPGAPTGLAAAFDAAAGGVRLSWSAAAGTPPAYYLVLRRYGGDQTGFYQTILSTTAAVVVDRPFGSGTYFYQVKAVNADGLESAPAGPAAADFDVTPPQPVTDLGATVLDGPSGLVRLAWSAPSDDFSGVYSYDIRSATFALTEQSFDSADVVDQSVMPSAPGALETALVGVEAGVSLRLGLKAVDLLGNRSGLSNVALLDLAPPQIESIGLGPGLTLARPRTIRPVVTDEGGGLSVSFKVDGTTKAIDTSPAFEFVLDPAALSDGSHVLSVVATDDSGNVATSSVAFLVNYLPPAVPSISYPTQNVKIASASLDVTGVAEPGVSVAVYVDGILSRSAVTSPDGQFLVSGVNLPEEGAVAITVAASDLRGASAQSSPVTVILDFGPPGEPQFPTATALAGGRIRLTWLPPSGEAGTLYRIYRSTVEAALVQGSTPPASLRVAEASGLEFTDPSAPEGLTFFAISAVDAASNEGPLSEVAPAVADGVPPTASVSLPQSGQPLAPGQHPVRVAVSEVLATPPILTFTPQGRLPALVTVTPLTPTLWEGTVKVGASINSETASFAFQGSDIIGNVGSSIVAGATVALNARGPSGTVLLSTALAGVGPLSITLALDEAAILPPTLSVTPRGRASIPITLTSAGAGDRWTGTFLIDTGTGDGPANLSYSAQDAVGNVGSQLASGATFFVIDTIPPLAPHAFAASAVASGGIELRWEAPNGETPSLYHVYRDDVRMTPDVVSGVGGDGTLIDHPEEGEHAYAVAGVDAAGNEGPRSGTLSLFSDGTPPGTPSGLTAELAASAGIDLTWFPAPGEPAASYRLYRSTSPIVQLGGLTYSTASVAAYRDVPGEDGQYHYAVTTLDAAGNQSGRSNVAQLEYLGAPPRIAVTGVGDDGVYGEAVRPSFSVTGSDLDAQSVVARLDGAPFASGSEVSSEGTHSLFISASDTGGHEAAVNVAFRIDRTPPAIGFSGVQNGALLHSSVSVTIIVEDANLQSTSFVLTNLTLGTTASYTSGLPITADGSYVLAAGATDRAGNLTTTSIAFSVDTTPSRPQGLTVRLEAEVGTDLFWSKPAADVLAYRVYRDGVRISPSLHSTTTFHDAGYWGQAARVYEVAAVDRVGQEGERARLTLFPLALSLAGFGLAVEGQEAFTRGFEDAVRLSVTNGDAAPRLLGPVMVTLSGAGILTVQAEVPASSVNPGAAVEFVGRLPVSPLAPILTSLTASLVIPTEDGTQATLVRRFTLPVRDPQAPVVEVFPGPLVRDTEAPVRVRINNRGSAPFEVRTAIIDGVTPSPTDEVAVSLKTAEGTVLAVARLAQTIGVTARVVEGRLTYFAVVEPGASLLFDPVLVAVPQAAGATLQVEGRVKGFSSAQSQAAVSAPSYTATVSPSASVYDQGALVTLAGEARDQGQALLPGATVQIRVASKGYVRTLEAVTGPSGTYSATFHPSPNEAGVYNLSAYAHGEVSNAVQAAFSIVGFSLSAAWSTARLSQNSADSLSIALTNTGETGLSGLSGRLEGVPPGLDVAPPALPSSLAAGSRVSLTLRIVSPAGGSVGTFALTLIVSDSNGFERRFPFSVEVSASEPNPRVTPQAFRIGMLAGETRRQAISLENLGFAPWQDVVVSAPTLPWVKVVGANQIGTVLPNQNASFALSFEPPDDLPTGDFVQNPLVEVRSSNGQTIPLNVGITLTSSKQGNLSFSIINADRPRDAAGKGVPVPGADVTLTGMEIGGLTFSVKADANGIAAFAAVPTGEYTWRVQASGFSPTSGVEKVESGLTKQLEALLPTTMVTYDWNVTETTVKDIYNITLQTTFKTDVPAPTVVIEPSFFDLNLEGGQSANTQVTVTNKGLVSAYNVELGGPQGDPEIKLEFPFTKIPELRAGQSVTIPVRVTLASASCHTIQIPWIAFGYRCAAGNEIYGPYPITLTFRVGNSCPPAIDDKTTASAQQVSVIAGNPGPKPCRCEVPISGPTLIEWDVPVSYSAKLKGFDCPCSLNCGLASQWGVSGGLEIISQSGCQATIRATGADGTISFSKGGLTSCDAKKDVTVKKTYKLKSVTFGGAGYSSVKRDSGEYYETPHWQDEPATSSPVTYPRSNSADSFMEVSAKFEIRPPPPTGTNIRVRGFGSGSRNVPETQISGSGSSIISLPMTSLSDPLPGNVEYFRPFSIAWEIQVDNGPWNPLGQSNNDVYVTLRPPLNPRALYRTVLDLATAEGNASDDAAAVNATWSQFETKFVRTWDDRPLYYYKPGLNFNKTCAIDSAELLGNSTGSGQCGSFAVLFLDALSANGISSVISHVTSSDEAFLVKNWTPLEQTFGGPEYKWMLFFDDPGTDGSNIEMVPPPAQPNIYGDLRSDKGIAGQGSDTPAEKVFRQHWIVKQGGNYYDPSYGTTYLNQLDGEQQAIFGHAKQTPEDVDLGRWRVRSAQGASMLRFNP